MVPRRPMRKREKGRDAVCARKRGVSKGLEGRLVARVWARLKTEDGKSSYLLLGKKPRRGKESGEEDGPMVKNCHSWNSPLRGGAQRGRRGKSFLILAGDYQSGKEGSREPTSMGGEPSTQILPYALDAATDSKTVTSSPGNKLSARKRRKAGNTAVFVGGRLGTRAGPPLGIGGDRLNTV